jgi:TonB family protein
MSKSLLAAIALTALTCGVARGAEDSLDAARQLYLSAAYEEALVTLARLPQGTDPDQIDKFRALCLLALNRTDEATKTLESLAIRRPLLKLDDSESPKLVQTFKAARARVLPPAAKSLYIAAKSNFEKGQLETAKGQFSDLLALLGEPELSAQPETADLRLLADGFAKLVDQQTARQATPAPASAARVTEEGSPSGSRASDGNATPQAAITPQPSGAAPPLPPVASAPQSAVASAAAARMAPREAPVYTADDGGVIEPVPLEQRLPPWIAPSGWRNVSFSGLIEVLIDEAGKVTSAAVIKSVSPAYDRQLLEAAKRWVYKPAQRDGRSVRFRRVMSVVLSPKPTE